MLQENGDWTWEKFAEIAQMATRDEDGDGENDLWGLAIQGHNLYSPLILSNNANIINFDENGRAIYALDDPNAIEALQFLRICTTKVVVPGGANHTVFEGSPLLLIFIMDAASAAQLAGNT